MYMYKQPFKKIIKNCLILYKEFITAKSGIFKTLLLAAKIWSEFVQYVDK